MGGKDGMRDPRFKVMHKDEELSLVTRSRDSQMLFLANMASKMNHETPLGIRRTDQTTGILFERLAAFCYKSLIASRLLFGGKRP